MYAEKSLPKVNFHAYIAAHQECAANQNIVFKTVSYNDGSAYNVPDGVFTAPHPGNYIFASNMRSAAKGTFINARMFANGKVVAQAYQLEGATMNVMTSLKKGEKVHVQALEKFTSHGNAPHVYFTGMLVSQ